MAEDAEGLNRECFELSRRIAALDFAVPQAAALARTLLRVVGRIVIDAGVPGADPRLWPETELMALRWVQEALEPLGYRVAPLPGSGRPEVTPETFDWS